MFKSIKWRILTIYVILISVCILMVLISSTIILRKYFMRELKEKLSTNAYLLSDTFSSLLIKSKEISQIRSLVDKLAQRIKSRITIIDIDGKVIGDSEKSFEEIPLMENLGNRPEVKKAIKSNIGSNIHFSDTLKIDMFYLAVPIKDQEGNILGVARVASPLTDVKKSLFKVQWCIIFSGVIVVLFTFFISYILATRTISSPIRQMDNIVQKMSQANFEERIRINLKDEIGQLGKTLNHMADRLREIFGKLSMEKEQMEAMLNSMTEGVIALNKESKIILVNSVIEQIFNLKEKEIIGKYPLEVIRNNELNEILEEVFKSEKPIIREIKMVLLLVEKIFEVHASVFGKKNKEYQGAIAVLYDITELRRLEKVRAEFVANVSHELRTPLSSIKGFVETLKDGALDDPENNRKFLGIIERHTQRLNSLIEDLLQLSKIESKEIKMELESVNLKELTEGIIFNFREAIEKKQHEIKIEIPPSFPLIKTESEKIEQVLSNLLDNAIKFTPEKGKITITAIEQENDIRVEVADTGIGISQEHLPRIFERFYRVDKARSRKLGGTGLGLAIVKHIVQAHNGKVGVESQPNKGSKFFFTFRTFEYPKTPVTKEH